MHRIPLTAQDTHHTSQFSHFEIASFHISCIHPSLLWLRLCDHYYVSINQWAQLPGSGRIYCVHEGTPYYKRRQCMTAGVPAPISNMGNTCTSGKWFTYLLCLCCASVCADIRVVDQTYQSSEFCDEFLWIFS